MILIPNLVKWDGRSGIWNPVLQGFDKVFTRSFTRFLTRFLQGYEVQSLGGDDKALIWGRGERLGGGNERHNPGSVSQQMNLRTPAQVDAAPLAELAGSRTVA